MSEFELLETIPVGNILGECILWDEVSASVWWTDINASRLFRYTPATSKLERFELPERLCSFGFIDSDRRLICAFASGFAYYDCETHRVDWLYRPELQFRGTRFNDGRVDRQGRFWSGTMIEGEATDSAGLPATGSLYWVSGAGHGRAFGDVQISNSLCWSLDGTRLYFADSPTRKIRAIEMDPATAALGASRDFAAIERPGVPDGSVIDAEGFLWNAQWGGAKLARYSPDGMVSSTFGLPVSQPTCLCFGGESFDWLFVSTATEGLSEAQLRKEPEAGNVLIYRTAFRGLPEDRFRP